MKYVGEDSSVGEEAPGLIELRRMNENLRVIGCLFSDAVLE